MASIEVVINKIEKLLEKYPEEEISEKTRTNYELEVVRLFADIKNSADAVARALKTSSSGTWYRRRAALMYFCRGAASALFSQYHNLQNFSPDHEAANIRSVEKDMSEVLSLWETICQQKKPEVKPRRSKRRDLQGLPVDWREKLLARMSRYREAILVLAITGCRPDELVKGVTVFKMENGLVIEIKGSKVKDTAGQPWRRHIWRSENYTDLVRQLDQCLGDSAGHITVKIEDARRFSGAVRAAAKREWPSRRRTVTPYSFRHQTASDWKSEGHDLVSISGGLGHKTTKMQTQYGISSQGRGTGCPEVETSREVHEVEKDSHFIKLGSDKGLRF